MENQVKINSLELENVKRIKAVAVVPTPTGLNIIGGNNKVFYLQFMCLFGCHM